MDYKEVEKIELYDAGVVLQPKDYGDGPAGWPYALGQSYYIDGRSVDKLAQWLGRPKKGEAPNLHIFKQPMVIGDGLSYDSEGYIIGKLWAKIEQPQLLQVRIRYVQRKSNGDQEDEDFDQDFTYSGSFNVWWAMCDREQIE